MKVILNEDVKHLGEEGDIKDVANGYARNYLFPRSLAVPCNPMTLAYFETRKADIEAKKEAKRADAAGLKEKLEAAVVEIAMPAGANGKLYGAVTNQTVTEALHNLGFEVERKRVELPGLTFKSVGKYHAVVRLYENASATVQVVVSAQGASGAAGSQPAPVVKEAASGETNSGETAASPEPAADGAPVEVAEEKTDGSEDEVEAGAESV